MTSTENDKNVSYYKKGVNISVNEQSYRYSFMHIENRF